MRFYSSWSDTFMIGGTGLFILVLGAIEYGFTKAWFQGLIFLTITFMIMVYSRYGTRIEINERMVSNFGFRNFGHEVLDVLAIRYIGRAQSLAWKSGGSLMILYALGENGEIIQTTLKEKVYNSKTLFEILRSIKKINPNIVFDRTYADIINSDNPNEVALNSIPSVLKVTETDAQAAKVILRAHELTGSDPRNGDRQH